MAGRYCVLNKWIHFILYQTGIALILLLTLSPEYSSSGNFKQTPLCVDFNKIDSVIVDSSVVRFISKIGCISYRNHDNDWQVTGHPRYLEPVLFPGGQKNNTAADQSYPHDAVHATYVDVMKRVSSDSSQMVLVNLAGGEGVCGTQCIIDTLRRATFCFPFNGETNFAFGANWLWLGQPDRIVRICRQDGLRSDFIVLPFFNNASKFLADWDHLWVASDGIGIEQFLLGSDSVIFRSISDLFRKYPEKNIKIRQLDFKSPKIEQRSRYKAVFSNFVMGNNEIHIGCRFVDSHNWLENDDSFILTFNKATREWSIRVLPNIRGLHTIDYDGSELWVGVNHLDPCEGWGMKSYGGLFRYKLSTENIIEVEGIDSRFLITKIIDEGLYLILDAYQFGDEYARKSMIRMDKRTLRTEMLSDFEWRGDADCNEYISIYREYEIASRSGLGNIGPSSLPVAFKKQFVKPRIIQLDVGMPRVDKKHY